MSLHPGILPQSLSIVLIFCKINRELHLGLHQYSEGVKYRVFLTSRLVLPNNGLHNLDPPLFTLGTFFSKKIYWRKNHIFLLFPLSSWGFDCFDIDSGVWSS